MAIWPAAYTLVDDGGKLAIQDDTGHILAHIGDQVQVGGGRIADGPAPWQTFEVLRNGPPAECAGPYWLASRELVRDNP
ncbi:MAG: hypothetical protein MUD01_05710 [Chloroflexaceae bacterium]|nr:hypothetical protein [Chloroflexaceae bacterium]